jgi:hypothetical protein
LRYHLSEWPCASSSPASTRHAPDKGRRPWVDVGWVVAQSARAVVASFTLVLPEKAVRNLYTDFGQRGRVRFQSSCRNCCSRTELRDGVPSRRGDEVVADSVPNTQPITPQHRKGLLRCELRSPISAAPKMRQGRRAAGHRCNLHDFNGLTRIGRVRIPHGLLCFVNGTFAVGAVMPSAVFVDG